MAGKLPPRGYYNEGANLSQDSISSRQRTVTPGGSQRELVQPGAGGGADEGETVGLKKRVGLVSGIALIVGTMIGSGIFISPAGVTEGAGSVGFTLIAWLLCGIISTFGALSYAELGTHIPVSGAEYAYLGHGFGSLHPVIGPLPAFLFSWINMVLLKPAQVAIIILAFATYTLEPIHDSCRSSDVPVKCLAALAICVLMFINIYSVRLATIVQNVLTVAKIIALIIIILGGFAMLGKVLIAWVNCYSVELAARVQVIFTVAKIIALIVIIIGGFVKLGQGNTQYLDTGFDNTNDNIGAIAIGLYNGMWAYDGWNNLNYVTEEIINPVRNLPLAIMIGIPLVTVLYLLVNISYFTVMSVDELLNSPAVAVTWAEDVIGPVSWLIPIFVALSTFGAVNGSLFTAGRLNYVAAREGHQVEILSMVHVKKYTPLPSIIFTSIIALIMIIPGDIGSLIDFFSFAVWMFYAATMMALIVMRFTRKDEVRPYKVPIILPIIVFVASCYLVVAPIIDAPQIEYLYAAIFIVAGFFFYFPFVHYKWNLPGIEKFTSFCQLLFEVSPPEESVYNYKAASETTI